MLANAWTGRVADRHAAVRWRWSALWHRIRQDQAHPKRKGALGTRDSKQVAIQALSPCPQSWMPRAPAAGSAAVTDRQSGVLGKRAAGRVALGVRRNIKKKKKKKT